MKKMTRNEFLKMAGTSAALVVFNTVLMPAAVAVEPGVVALEFTGIATAANGDMYSVVDGATLAFSVTK